MKYLCRILWLSLILAYGSASRAQPVQSKKRQEIDAKRTGVDIHSADALPRSREFIRIDSSYYVGWMFEGTYKMDHAADFRGYQNAIAPLKKALDLITRDYARQLSTRTGDLLRYYPAYRYHQDYTFIAAQLTECYSNTNQPEKAFEVTRLVQRWNFQADYNYPLYATKAWIVHRNRFFTSAQYPFLENSIPANERLANAFLDSGLVKIEEDARLNASIFQPRYADLERQTIYHYKAMLYSYAIQIDSAMHFYRLMKAGPLFSFNNFATFLSICGDFREAERNYEIASAQDMGDKRLQEWAYYSAGIDIFQAKPDRGAQLMQDMIRAAGSTPGFGWYNIALARCEFYGGRLDKSEYHIEKAAQFKEVHIGTTLGQSHYDFSVNLVKLMNDIGRIQQLKFEHRNWWYHIGLWPKLAGLTTAKYLQQYLLVSQLALNPERDKVIYSLFSTESTVIWDEIWFLIRDFSTTFFYDKFRNEMTTDRRRLIRKYYQLFCAGLQMQKGNYEAAQASLQTILDTASVDNEYEKLFLFRVYEKLGICAEENDKPALAAQCRYQMYILFPQQLPFSDLIPAFRLETSGSPDREFIDRLKSCRIKWVNQPDAPVVHLNFSDKNDGSGCMFVVRDKDGNELLKPQTYFYKDSDKAALHVAYALFKINKQSQ